MKTVVTVASRQMELVEKPEPDIGPDEALIGVEYVGLCGSDLHFFLGDHPYVTYPQVQGHEFSGTILALGEAYTGPLHVGERVAVEPLVSCGECYPCRIGRPNCCTHLAVLGAHRPGALTEKIVVQTNSLYPVGDLDPELAALVEPLSIGLQAVKRGAITAEDTVVVFGAGPIGQAVLIGSTDRGARVLVIDKLDSRLELAQKLGAERVVNTDKERVADVIAAWTHGEGPAVVFDATGVPAVIRQAIDSVASAGRVVIIGLSNQEVSIPVIEFTRKELTILGSRNNARIFGEAVALVQRNRARVRMLITHRFPLAQTQQALEFALEHPTEAEKVIIHVGGDV